MPIFPSKYWTRRWTPAQISNLALWLDAADNSTLTLNGSSGLGPLVEQWRDKSGANRHANQSDSSARPVLRVNEKNGRNAIRFDGTSDFMKVAAFDGTPTNIWVIVSSVETGTRRTILRKGRDASSAFPADFFLRYDGASSVQAATYDSSGAGTSVIQAGLQSAGSLQIISATQVPGLNTAALWYNGTVQNVAGFSSPQRYSAATELRVGANFATASNSAAGSDFWYGRIYEVIITKDEVIDDERLAIEGYLAWKWDDPTVILPVDHPYRNSPPWHIEPYPLFYVPPKQSITSDWTPAQLGSDLKVWLDPTDTATLTLNGSSVTQWADKSGNNNHVVQAIASAQPTYSATALGTKPGLVFDGMSDYLQTANNIISGNVNLSMAAVWRVTNTGIRTALFVGTAATGAGVGLGRNDSAGHLSFIWGGGSSNSSVTSVNVQRLQVLTLAASTSIQAGLNGNVYTAAIPTATNITAGTLSVGSETRATRSQWLQGQLGEVIVAAKAFSTSERQLVEGYLAHRWDLASALPSDHPYKGAAPTVTNLVNATPWTPANLGAALTAWYDAADVASIVLNGSNVSQWTDKSGLNVHMTQGTAANQPVYIDSSIYGRPVVRFDGTDDRLQRATKPYTLGGNRSVFQVARTRSHAEKPWVVAAGGSGVTMGAVEFRASPVSGYGMELQVRRVAIAYATQPNYYDRNDANPGENLEPRLVGLVQNGTALTGHFAGTETAATTLRGISERNDTVNEYRYGDVDIGEVVITNTALAQADREKLEGYLAHKWGLNEKLPTNHPYYTRPPYL